MQVWFSKLIIIILEDDMKKIISLFSAVILISTFFGCASTDGVQYSNPTEYVEFESWEIRTNSEFQNQAYHVKRY